MQRRLCKQSTTMTSLGTYVVVVVALLIMAGVDSHPQSCSLTVVPDNGLVHVFPGSDVTFVCSATCLGALSRDQLVWRDPHGNIVASFGGDRVHAVSYNRWMVSRLVVRSAEPDDSGVYTCQVQHGTRLLQYTAVLQVQDNSGSMRDLGPRRGDIFIQPEVEFGDIRPVRSASRQIRRRFPGNHRHGLLDRLQDGSGYGHPAGSRRVAQAGNGGKLLHGDLADKNVDETEKFQVGVDDGDVQTDIMRKEMRVRRQALSGNPTFTSHSGSQNSMADTTTFLIHTQQPIKSTSASAITGWPRGGDAMSVNTASTSVDPMITASVTDSGPEGGTDNSSQSTVSPSSKGATGHTRIHSDLDTESFQATTVAVLFSRNGRQSTSSSTKSGYPTTGSSSGSESTSRSSTGSGSSSSGSESGSSDGSGSGTGEGSPRGQNPNTGISSATKDGERESDFGKYGMLAFGLALGAAVLLFYALLLVILIPKCCKRKNLSLNSDRQAYDNRESDVVLLTERPHKPLATMTSATGLNGEYITSVDLDAKAGGEAGQEKATDKGQEQERDSNPQDSYVSTFLVGRLSSSKQTDEETPADITTAPNDDNVFAADSGFGDSRNKADSSGKSSGGLHGTAGDDRQPLQSSDSDTSSSSSPDEDKKQWNNPTNAKHVTSILGAAGSDLDTPGSKGAPDEEEDQPVPHGLANDGGLMSEVHLFVNLEETAGTKPTQV